MNDIYGKNQFLTRVKRYNLIRICIRIPIPWNYKTRKVETIHDDNVVKILDEFKMSWRCIKRCVNSALQTRWDKTQIKKVTKGTGKGKRKRRWGKAKGGHPTQQTLRTQTGRAEKERGEGKTGRHTTAPSEGKGTAGDDQGYTPTLEDLRLW